MIYHVEWPVGGPPLRPHYSVSSRALLLFPILIVLHHLQTLRAIKESVERVSLFCFQINYRPLLERLARLLRLQSSYCYKQVKQTFLKQLSFSNKYHLLEYTKSIMIIY